MISPELLLRYPFFGSLNDTQLTSLAMMSQEQHCMAGDTLFQMGAPADTFYFLLEGSVELHCSVTSPHTPGVHKDYYVGHVNPGEPFGISALIEPYRYTASALAGVSCHILTMDAGALRAYCQSDTGLAAALMRQIAKTALSRMNETRVQLAAAQMP